MGLRKAWTVVGAHAVEELRADFCADVPGAEIVGLSADAMIGKAAVETDRLAAWFGR